MPPLPTSLQQALDRGAPVVAPTALAAATLRAGYDHRQRAAGHTVWQPANVLSWPQWLGSLWTGLILSGHESRLLLNPSQEELLWRDLILPTLDPANLASAPAFAELARSAFALAAGYNATGRLASAANQGAGATEDTEQFARWAADFNRLCGRHAYLPAARLPATLGEHLTRQHFAPPAELHLTECLDTPPADEEFLQVLRRAGTRIVQHPRTQAAPITRTTLRATREPEEFHAIAHWLRDFLDAYIETNGPCGPEDLPTIHVILAGPSPDRAALDSIFREVLAPELNLITADPSSAPWEHAAGHPLAGQPIVATLLRLLRGLDRPLAVDDVSALLLSSHLGPVRDQAAAAQLDAWSLRDRPPLRPEITLRELHRQAQRSPFGQSTLAWLRPLLTFLDKEADLAAPRTHADWTAFIRQVAEAIYWPGPQPLTSIEFAATQVWDHTLDSLAPLDFNGRRVPFREALAALERQVQAATVRLPTHPPIRILSAAEAAILPCDALVLAQATDTNWPPAARPHPLLPWALQVAAGMPGANPSGDAARAERLTEALLARTPHVLLTHSAEANDAPQRLAPSLGQLTKGQTDPPWQALAAVDLIPPSGPVVAPEQFPDATPLPPLPSPHVAGGATVLQRQAACGFRAFAELRLRSTEPNAPTLGFDARRAGSLLHDALDIFWQRVQSQTNLLSLPEEVCDDHLQSAVQQAFTRVPPSEDPWDKAYRALQMQRLFEVLKSWLSFERLRHPFTVLSREQDRQLTVGPLELQLRIDRMDEVVTQEGSGTVLIDYKTGYDANPAAWESERPDQPQLPLYTLLPNASELRGLAFARVRAGQSTWAGLQAEPGLLGKTRVEPGLADLVIEWRRVLTRLAEQFAAGDHSVNPKSYPVTCTHCGQRFLCRLDPNTLLASAAEEDEDAEREETVDG